MHARLIWFSFLRVLNAEKQGRPLYRRSMDAACVLKKPEGLKSCVAYFHEKMAEEGDILLKIAMNIPISRHHYGFACCTCIGYEI